MKQKDIVKEIRLKIDSDLNELGFIYKSKSGDYIMHKKDSKLYFKISFLFMDFVDYNTALPSKYIELFVNIYHEDISKILLETSERSFLDSIFYFKLAGNMLSDIVLNPDIYSYTNRNNHNYFKLTFVSEADFVDKPFKILSIIKEYAIPFFEKLSSLEKIKNILDQSYEQCLAIHNANNERLLALAALLFFFNDNEIDQKLERIKNHFISIDHKEALRELSTLITRCS